MMRRIDRVAIAVALGIVGTGVIGLGGAALRRAELETHLYFLTVSNETQRRVEVQRIANIGPRAVPRLLEEARVAQPFMPEEGVRCLERMFGFEIAPLEHPFRFWDQETIDAWAAWFFEHEKVLQQMGAESEAFGIPFPEHYAGCQSKPPRPVLHRLGGA